MPQGVVAPAVAWQWGEGGEAAGFAPRSVDTGGVQRDAAGGGVWSGAPWVVPPWDFTGRTRSVGMCL